MGVSGSKGESYQHFDALDEVDSHLLSHWLEEMRWQRFLELLPTYVLLLSCGFTWELWAHRFEHTVLKSTHPLSLACLMGPQTFFWVLFWRGENRRENKNKEVIRKSQQTRVHAFGVLEMKKVIIIKMNEPVLFRRTRKRTPLSLSPTIQFNAPFHSFHDWVRPRCMTSLTTLTHSAFTQQENTFCQTLVKTS